ncbi:hypothetical protein ONS95_005142 [Cadophora gregata]|uniref:uncharacterized protein n=1 Tax=Cadophora gregata TaxID=51156 RepID=UPI0026DDAB81|nr:uncharacterized protein ONS95_005142 [Cadophora gregata]KAK0104876.1 hypothetical protein ONS95_005142 [Cadophora gregata]KAK0115045.1 hypothetical protein ONS96_013515 [Cadophora gregata f. sp. sojae]
MSRLPNKTTFLTGGASGIGLAIASIFLSHGSNVFILDSSAENIATAGAHLASLFPPPSPSTSPPQFISPPPSAQSISNSPPRSDAQNSFHTSSKFLFKQGDAADSACLKDAIDECVEVFGGLDIVVLNAGVLPRVKGILEVSGEEWERVMKVNAFGPFIGIQLSARKMIEINEQNHNLETHPLPSPPTTTSNSNPTIGTILLTCSTSGLRSRPGVSTYTMSKFAVRGLTIAAAQELGKFGIRVNAVCPGMVDTPLLRGAGLDSGRVGREGALERFGTPEEVAKVFLFLASEDASFVTGSLYRVDGGLVDS